MTFEKTDRVGRMQEERTSRGPRAGYDAPEIVVCDETAFDIYWPLFVKRRKGLNVADPV